jgi:ankyrin repeat protein
MLLEKNANPSLIDAQKKTAIDYALESDKMPVVELLRKHGGKAAVDLVADNKITTTDAH